MEKKGRLMLLTGTNYRAGIDNNLSNYKGKHMTIQSFNTPAGLATVERIIDGKAFIRFPHIQQLSCVAESELKARIAYNEYRAAHLIA
jgi:hypothetical protein